MVPCDVSVRAFLQPAAFGDGQNDRLFGWTKTEESDNGEAIMAVFKTTIC
jgi:hypothetical protein